MWGNPIFAPGEHQTSTVRFSERFGNAKVTFRALADFRYRTGLHCGSP